MKKLFGYPLINDVTTTPDAPLRFPGGGIPDYPRAFAAAQREAYPDLAPKALAGPAAAAFERVAQQARAMDGWSVVEADAAARRLVAVATTKALRFKDDIVIEVREAGGRAEVHMRSRSRLGRGDFGANAKRIRAFFATL